MPTTRTHQLRLVVAALATVLMVAVSAPAIAATLVVAADGQASSTNCDDPRPAPFTTIRSAVRAAAPYDTVRVCAGVYDEQVQITKPLTLQG